MVNIHSKRTNICFWPLEVNLTIPQMNRLYVLMLRSCLHDSYQYLINICQVTAFYSNKIQIERVVAIESISNIYSRVNRWTNIYFSKICLPFFFNFDILSIDKEKLEFF